jgi:tetratricopeptide (TPR) repeat protein
MPRRWSFGIVAALLAMRGTALAQDLTPKRAIAGDQTLGCPASAPAAPRRDSPDARRFTEIGHEAEIVGDHRAARDAYAQAATLNPGDERVAYYLARAHEELKDVPAAVREYCRYLTLAPDAEEAPDVRIRLQRLAPPRSSAVTEEVRAAFRNGLAAYDKKSYAAAVESFSSVIRRAPIVPEGYYNRAAAYQALGRRAQAAADLQRYVALRPTGTEAAEAQLQLQVLRRPLWSPPAALAQGLIIPGLGQVYTARPIRGLLVFGVTAGAAIWGLQEKQVVKTRTFTDIFGNQYVDSLPSTDRPNLTAGMAIAGTVLVASAVEAYRYARRSRDTAPPRGARTPVAASSRAWTGWSVLASPSAVGVRIGLP